MLRPNSVERDEQMELKNRNTALRLNKNADTGHRPHGACKQSIQRVRGMPHHGHGTGAGGAPPGCQRKLEIY